MPAWICGGSEREDRNTGELGGGYGAWLNDGARTTGTVRRYGAVKAAHSAHHSLKRLNAAACCGTAHRSETQLPCHTRYHLTVPMLRYHYMDSAPSVCVGEQQKPAVPEGVYDSSTLKEASFNVAAGEAQRHRRAYPLKKCVSEPT